MPEFTKNCIIFLFIMFGGKLMKASKITALILAAALCAMPLTACNKEKKPVSSGINIISSQGQAGVNGDSRFVVDPNAEANNFFFKYNDVKVVIGITIDKVLSGLGNNYTIQEAQSCAGQGTALNYIFNGGSFTIETTPAGSANYITMIALGDDSVSTAEGIFIGNSVAQVKAAYGDPIADSTEESLMYDKGSSRLTFVIDAEEQKVTSIFYQAKM